MHKLIEKLYYIKGVAIYVRGIYSWHQLQSRSVKLDYRGSHRWLLRLKVCAWKRLWLSWQYYRGHDWCHYRWLPGKLAEHSGQFTFLGQPLHLFHRRVYSGCDIAIVYGGI